MSIRATIKLKRLACLSVLDSISIKAYESKFSNIYRLSFDSQTPWQSNGFTTVHQSPKQYFMLPKLLCLQFFYLCSANIRKRGGERGIGESLQEKDQ